MNDLNMSRVTMRDRGGVGKDVIALAVAPHRNQNLAYHVDPPRSEQSVDQAVLVYADVLSRRHAWQARHCHDFAADDDNKARTG